MTHTDTTTIEATVDRYFDSWNETEADARAAISREVWADGARYVDPLIDATGPQEIADAIGGLQAQMPGHRLQRVTAVDVHHDHARFGWTATGPDGAVALAGTDVALLGADGKLLHVAGFLGEQPTITA